MHPASPLLILHALALVVLVALTLATGLVAAGLWWKSSQVPIDPQGGEQSGDEQTAHRAWTVALLQSSTTVAGFNKRAALWTAASVALGAVLGVVGNWAAVETLWRWTMGLA